LGKPRRTWRGETGRNFRIAARPTPGDPAVAQNLQPVRRQLAARQPRLIRD